MTTFTRCPLWKHHEASILISRFFVSRRPIARALLAPFLLHAYRLANGEEGSGRASAPLVQKRPGRHRGEVRLAAVWCLAVPVWQPQLTLLPAPPASGGRGRPWTPRMTAAPGGAGLTLTSCSSPWARPPLRTPS